MTQVKQLPFPLQFKRQFSAPMDADMTFASVAELNAYLTNDLRFPDQTVTCLGRIYTLSQDRSKWIPQTLWEIVDNKIVCIDGYKIDAESIDSDFTTNVKITFGTYDEIKTLVVNEQLKPENFYVITDFKTTYIQNESGLIKDGTIEPLTLIAATKSKFYKSARSSFFPNDEITYDFFGTSNYYDNSQILSGTGKITWRKDSNNNSAYYDIRNVKWFSNNVEYLTFGNNCYNNKLGFDSLKNILGDNCINNNIESNVTNINLVENPNQKLTEQVFCTIFNNDGISNILSYFSSEYFATQYVSV